LPGVHNLFAAADALRLFSWITAASGSKIRFFCIACALLPHTEPIGLSTRLFDGHAPMYPHTVDKVVWIMQIYLFRFQLMRIIIFWIICARPISVCPRPHAVVWPQVLHFCPRSMTGLNKLLCTVFYHSFQNLCSLTFGDDKSTATIPHSPFQNTAFCSAKSY